MSKIDTRFDDVYNEDFLDENGAHLVAGYDTACAQIKDLITKKLQDYKTELSTTRPANVEYANPDEEVFATREDLYEILMNDKEIIDCVFENFLMDNREELIASYIDEMDREQYEDLRNKAFKENPDKKYFNTAEVLQNGNTRD